MRIMVKSHLHSGITIILNYCLMPSYINGATWAVNIFTNLSTCNDERLFTASVTDNGEKTFALCTVEVG